jgi:hypothetical protein
MEKIHAYHFAKPMMANIKFIQLNILRGFNPRPPEARPRQQGKVK